MFNKSTILLSMVAIFAVNTVEPVGFSFKPARHGDWQKSHIKRMRFSSNFQFGASLFANEAIESDHWNRFAEDIQLIKEAGLTTFLFSLDWNKIEPSQGYFDEHILQHYVDFCDELIRNGIEPVIILKDYCDPVWFIDCGGFEKECNIALFERYCSKVLQALQGRTYKVITFWAPESYAMLSYWTKAHAPFKKNMQLAIDVFANELEAHVRVYQSFKKADATLQVGITKHVIQLEPRYPWDRLACSMANSLTNTPFYNFFTTGKFDVSVRTLPAKWGGVVKHYRNSLAPYSVDFIGINYHCHNQMRNFQRIPFANERKTDIKSITVDPKGLFFAIEEVYHGMAQALNIPIIITQNGIATTDTNLRRFHTDTNLCSVFEANKRGYNVQGYYYYSLLDGRSWGEQYQTFGLSSVDAKTLERVVKPGSSRLIEIAKNHRDARA